MNPRNTGILLLVAIALGAFLWFYVVQGEEGRQQAQEREKRLFSGIEPEDVTWIALTTSDGVAVRAQRQEKGWRIVEPLAFPGDAFALDGVASSLVQATSEAIYDSPQPLSVYGLDDASREVRFGVGDEEHALRLGNPTPIGGNTYATVVGEKPVYAIASFRANALKKDFLALREKHLLDFDRKSVDRIVVSWPGARVELVRDGEGFRLTAPVEGPADADAVEELLTDLSFLRAASFADHPPSDAEAGLAPPAFAAELTLKPEEEGAEPRHLSLAIGSAVVDDHRLVRTSELPSLARIPAERLDDFDRQVVAYRFKELSRFAADEARRVELVFAVPGGEPVTVTATREDGGWTSGPEAMDPEKIASLVEELSHLDAADILAEQVGPEELKTLGLAPANATLRVFGEGEGDDARLAEVRLGVSRATGVVAQTGENPHVFEVASELAEHLPVSLEAFRNRFLAPPPEPEAQEQAPMSPADPEADLGAPAPPPQP